MIFTTQRIKQLISSLALSSILLGTGCTENEEDTLLDVEQNGSTSISTQNLADTLDTLPLETVSNDEADGLKFMREEEKLAHDVYTTLYNQTGQNIFYNISNSEQTHTDAVKLLLERYGIDDPVTDNSIGVFINTNLASLYNALTAQGSASLIDALIVGATIEELDIVDIQEQLDNYVDNQDITLVYENLLKGSRNHLRSFYKLLIESGFIYSPVYLTQTQFDSIINSPIESQ